MLDVLELEKEWSKYHFKKMLPLYISSFFLTVIAAASSYVYLMHPDMIASLIQKEQVIVKSSPVAKTTLAQLQKPAQAVIVEVEKVIEQNVLAPSFNFIYDLEDQRINYNNMQTVALASAAAAKKKKNDKKATPPKNKKKRTTISKKKPAPVEKPKKVVKKPKKTPAKPVKKAVPVQKLTPVKQAITLGNNNSGSTSKTSQQKALQVGHSTTSEVELRSVIKRFNKSKKPALSLFIAKKYYDQGNYKESYNYARQTYKLNPKIEDGFILYAQSLAKLGKTDKAIAKLKPYIKKTGSVKAKILLSDIKKGNI